MIERVSVICMNTYREAVRARILHGLLALAVGTCGYALIVGAYSLRNQNRVVADLGAASISLYSILVAIFLGASSLYRELELKTIFPILARPIRRSEYLVGKFFGIVLTMLAFIAWNSGLLLFALGALTTRSLGLSIGVPLGILAAGALLGWRMARLRTWLPLPIGILLFGVGFWFASDGVTERAIITGQALLTFFEVCVVTSISMLFASFSSPFLTAIFTLAVFLVGRSADTLAKLPERLFGRFIKELGRVLSQVFPNLMVYVPPRSLLTGEAVGIQYLTYAGLAGLQALAWTVGLLALSVIVFRRRDFL